MLAAHKLYFRLVCWVMAGVTPLAPSAGIYAQTAAQTTAGAGAKSTPLRLEYLAPNSAAILVARPRQLLTCEATKMLPVEVISASCLKELGFDPVNIKSVLVSATPPLAGPPNYSVVLELTEHVELTSLSPSIIQHTIPGNLKGQDYLQSQHPALPSFYWIDDTTLLVAPEQTLGQLLSGNKRELDSFAKELATGSADDLLLLVNVAMLRPLIQMGLSQVASDLPPALQGLMELPDHLEQIRAKISISGAGPVELSCTANDAEAADRVEELLDEAIGFYRKTAANQAEKMLASEDTVEQAMGRYMVRSTPVWTKQLTPTRNENRFTLLEIPPENSYFGGTTGVAVIGVLVALLLPAVQAAREAARRNSSINNMKQLLLCLLIYNDTHGRFPAHASYDDDGKPLLSWRVHILPFMEGNALYKQFHLDEPWDSEHNRQLIPQMPVFFLDPSSKLVQQEGRTHYLGAEGEDFALDGTEEGRRIRDFTDGLSNTIMLVQVNDASAVTWTKPEDWEMDPKNKLQGLSPNLHPGIFQAGFCDGHVRAISEDIDQDVLLHLFTIGGGEAIDHNY